MIDEGTPDFSTLVDALASFRLVKLVRDDRVAEPLRTGVRRRFGDIDESKVAYLLQCPWCLSFWFGTALTLGRHRWPGATSALARALAVSALTGLLTEQRPSAVTSTHGRCRRNR